MDHTSVTWDPSAPERTHPDEHARAERLAELVAALGGCPFSVAVNAVLRSMPTGALTADASLEVVARALASVRHGIDLRDGLDLT